MNTLRLEFINLHAPYRVMQDPEKNNNFYFVSDSDARFDIDFTVNDSVIPSGAYEFGPPPSRRRLSTNSMPTGRARTLAAINSCQTGVRDDVFHFLTITALGYFFRSSLNTSSLTPILIFVSRIVIVVPFTLVFISRK